MPTLMMGLGLIGSSVRAAELQEERQTAVRAAASAVAESVVQIETLGGLEQVNGRLVSSGPTTGLIVSEDGLIVTSAYSVIQNPDSILVSLPDGERRSATIVARDHSRMLVLLRVATDQALPVPMAAPRDALRPGQTVVALGRTFSKKHVNLSVGIISATNRIWSRAIQTDANVSPANYGGPLVDLTGQVVGILVPLSPQSQNEVAGTEWYDSGIGFAVPLVDVMQKLPVWQTGQDLYPGRLGISLADQKELDPPAKIAVVKLNSPAAKSGLKQGDEIIGVDGVQVARVSQLRHALGPRYAFDTIQIRTRRDQQELDFELELTDKIPPYQHAFLGILPATETSDEQDTPQGYVDVQFVYPDSPAREVNLSADDRITQFDGQPVPDAKELRRLLANRQPGDAVAVQWQRGEQTESGTVTLQSLPNDVLDSAPPPVESADGEINAEEETGKLELSIPEEPNECVVYVPPTQGQARSLLVVLGEPGRIDVEAIIDRWREISHRHGVVIAIPKPTDETRWQPTETDYIRKVMDRAISRFGVDEHRVGILGVEAGGSMALLTGLRHRNVTRGIAVINAALPPRLSRSLPENEPLQRVALLFARTADSKIGNRMTDNIQRFREAKFPVTEMAEPVTSAELSEPQRAMISRWLVCLHRL